MSSSSRTLGAILMAVALTAPLAACTGLMPVYGERGLGTETVAVAYAIPNNRLEQIIYQDLALRLGNSAGVVPVVKISASRDDVALTNNLVTAPNRQRQMKVTAKVTVTDIDGEVMFSGTRVQTADYTTDEQALANQQAADDAARRAALLLAQTIRLEVIAALGR
jgi:LPS-assembly lipoprotein